MVKINILKNTKGKKRGGNLTYKVKYRSARLPVIKEHKKSKGYKSNLYVLKSRNKKLGFVK